MASIHVSEGFVPRMFVTPCMIERLIYFIVLVAGLYARTMHTYADLWARGVNRWKYRGQTSHKNSV
jgi:hypothetical protein